MAQSDDLARVVQILVRQMQIGLRGRSLRQAAGLQASQLAARCGTTESVVYAWERAEADPSLGEALRWLEAVHPAPRPAVLPERPEIDLPRGRPAARAGRPA